MLDIFQHRSWALSESFVARMLPVLSTWLVNGHSLDSLVKKKGASEYFLGIQALAAANDVKVEMQFDPELDMGLAKVNGKSIGVMSMIGSLTKYGGLCSPGMQDYQQMISKMNASDRVDGLVIIIDSPGGTVDGTPELGLAVKNSTKPIGFFGDGIVASAAYWVASQGSVIVGNKNNPTEFGSIGTLFISENWQNMIAAGNVQEFKIIRAPQSKQKALVNPIEPLTDDLENSIKDELKSITADFISTVKSGRGSALNTKLEGLFEGKMFDVNTAKANGMIDSVGDLRTALNKVAEIAKQRQSKAGTNVNIDTGAKSNSMKFPKLSKLISGEAWNKVLGIFASEDDQKALEPIETKLATIEADNERLTKEATEKDTKISSLETKVTELNGTVKTLSDEKATLTQNNTKLTEDNTALQKKVDAKPAGEKTTVVPDASKEAANANDKKISENKYETSVDREAKQIKENNEKNSKKA